MTVFLHELKRNRLALVIWTAAISFMLAICVVIYPEMSAEMNEISDMFANMGSFSDAFGMDQLNFGEFIGYFGIECGNVLGLGGAIFAAILGISALSKEERDGTAEFLLTHPIKRTSVATSKLFSSITQILIMNVTVVAVTVIGAIAIGEQAAIGTMLLIFTAYLFMQIEIMAITFCLSAILRAGLGLGIGIAFAFYFINILSNITNELNALKYLTPFSYTDAGYIVDNAAFDIKYLAIGTAVTVIAVVLAFVKYRKKEIK